MLIWGRFMTRSQIMFCLSLNKSLDCLSLVMLSQGTVTEFLSVLHKSQRQWWYKRQAQKEMSCIFKLRILPLISSYTAKITRKRKTQRAKIFASGQREGERGRERRREEEKDFKESGFKNCLETCCKMFLECNWKDRKQTRDVKGVCFIWEIIQGSGERKVDREVKEKPHHQNNLLKLTTVCTLSFKSKTQST